MEKVLNFERWGGAGRRSVCRRLSLGFLNWWEKKKTDQKRDRDESKIKSCGEMEMREKVGVGRISVKGKQGLFYIGDWWWWRRSWCDDDDDAWLRFMKFLHLMKNKLLVLGSRSFLLTNAVITEKKTSVFLSLINQNCDMCNVTTLK